MKGKDEFDGSPIVLDDFDVILGIEFMLAAKVSVAPYMGGITISDGPCPSFVSAAYDHKAL